MNTPSTLLVSFFIVTSAFAQSQPVVQWSRALGGSNMDFAGGMGMVVLENNGCAIVGEVASSDGDVAGSHGPTEAWLVVVDSTGEVDWQHCYGGGSNDAFTAIVPAADGGFVAAGSSWSNNGDVSGNHGNGGLSDAWVVGLNATGQILWQIMVGGTSGEQALALNSTADGGYVVAGIARSTDGDLAENAGDNDLLVFKLDATGALEWVSTFGGSAAEQAAGVTELDGGGFAVCGQTMSADGDVTGLHAGQDAWVVGLSATGDLLWQRTWGGTGSDLASKVLPQPGGGCIVSAFTNSTDGDITEPLGAMDSYLLGFDAAGELSWTRRFGGPNSDVVMDMQSTDDGGLLLYGSSYYDCWVKKLDPAYGEEWSFTDGLSSMEGANCGRITPDGGVMLAGTTQTSNNGLPHYHGLLDGFAMKLTFDYSLVRGSAFVDADGDAVHDAGELPLTNHLFRIDGTDRMDMSNNAGAFELSALQLGDCSTIPPALTHFTVNPAAHASNFTAFGQVDDTPVFAIQPNGVVNDLSVRLIPMGAFRLGFWAQYSVVVRNEGTTPQAPVLTLHADPHLNFIGSYPVPTITTDGIVWELAALQPLQQRSFEVTFEVAMDAPVYSAVLSELSVTPLIDDAVPADNTAHGPITFTTSCDPNVIHVDRAIIEPADIGGPLALEYTIEFQNTGNDTAFTVVVENPWPSNCDIASFQFIGASHPISISMDADHHRSWFRFENILLPDSTTNELRSHGYVRYSVKPNSDLVEGDAMLDQAGIYFDYNEPVITNTALTVVGSTVSIAEHRSDASFSVYPNPASNAVLVRTERAMVTARVVVMDAVGRVVLQQRMTGTTLTLDLGSLARGVYTITRLTESGAHSQHIVLE